MLYRKLLEKAAPAIASRSLSPEEMLSQLIRYLKDEETYVILTIDEIDYLCKRGEHVIYDLTRLNEVNSSEPINILGVILISRDLSYYKFLLGLGWVREYRYEPKRYKINLENEAVKAIAEFIRKFR